MQSYQVLLDGKVVGSANVVREGLYYSIRCRCQFHDNKIYRLMVLCNGVKEDLGVLVPMEGGFGVTKKVPQKKLSSGDMKFVAVLKNAEPGRFMPVDTRRPCDAVMHLEKARFCVHNGQRGLWIED